MLWGTILPEELRVEVALELGLEFGLDSKASLDQPSESSPDSKVLKELLNRFLLLVKWAFIVGSFLLILLLVLISLSFVEMLFISFVFMTITSWILTESLSQNLNSQVQTLVTLMLLLQYLYLEFMLRRSLLMSYHNQVVV